MRRNLKRTSELFVPGLLKEHPAILPIGPRQAGKTRMLRHLVEGREKGSPLWYCRDRDGGEIDIVIERDGHQHPVEIKMSAKPAADRAPSFGMLDRVPLPRGIGASFCMADSFGAVPSDALVLPTWAA